MRVDPYADAPRLPSTSHLDDRIDPSPLVGGAPGEAVELEIGPGRGWFLVERLELFPQVRIIGLEIRRKWATIVDKRVAARGLNDRGRVFSEDVKEALPRFPAGSCSIVYVHFPDPWWKKRHHKRLVVEDSVAEEFARVLIPGGELFVQTDVPERADEYQAVIERSGWFEPAQPEGARIADHPYQARSPRERRAMEDGIPIYRLRYRRRTARP